MDSCLCRSKKLDLDEHLLVEILKRLPVKVIGRIRSVCKSWNSLISSSFFVSKQMSFLSNNEPPRSICYLLLDPPSTWIRVISYSFYSPCQKEAPSFSPLPFNELYVDHDEVLYKQYGVIHGVVCLSRENGWPCAAGSAILWNPTIHKYAALPDTPRAGWVVLGFGFDARTNDFKVVRFMPDYTFGEPLPPRFGPPRFEVFSTRRGCWRSLASDNILGGTPFVTIAYCDCFMNGSNHWVIVGVDDGDNVLLVFDCEREEFKTMQVPQQIRNVRISMLFNQGGMLSVLAFGEGRGEDVWVMEEYGVSASWKKSTRPLRHFVTIDDDGVLFQDTDQVVRVRNYDRLNGSQHPMNGYVFQPSLFLMDNSNTLKVYDSFHRY